MTDKPADRPITIQTVNDLVTWGYRILKDCEACDRRAWVNLEAYVARGEGDRSYIANGLGLRCGKCHGPVQISIHAPSGYRTG